MNLFNWLEVAVLLAFGMVSIAVYLFLKGSK